MDVASIEGVQEANPIAFILSASAEGVAKSTP